MSVSLSYLIERVRLVSDNVSSSFVTDDELTKYINAAGAELHDVLVGVYEDYLMTGSVFTLTNNQAYTPPDDVFKIRGLDYQQGAYFFPCEQFNFAERFSANYSTAAGAFGNPPTYHWIGGNIVVYPEQSCGGTYKLWYILGWNDLVSGSNETLAAPYTYNHWEEYIVIDAGIRALQREDTDVSTLVGQKMAIVDRIRRAAVSRDAGGGKVVAMTRRMDGQGMAVDNRFRIFGDAFDETFT